MDNDPDDQRADWPVITPEDIDLLKTMKDSEALEQQLNAIGPSGRLVPYSDDRTAMLNTALES